MGLICLRLSTPNLAWQHFKTLTLAAVLVVRVSAFVLRSHHPHPGIDGPILKPIVLTLNAVGDSLLLFVQYSSVLPCSDCLWTVSVIAGPSGFIQVESGTSYIRT
jgi:hypothetical protein